MLAAPIPADETRRLAALRGLRLLDTAPEERFDRLVRLAQRLLGAPMASLTLIDENRQWFKARVGLKDPQTPRDVSFCGHAVADGRTLVVPDARKDARFADNPFVTGDPNIRFYAGCPLKTRDGSAVGTLCVIDNEPRELSAEQRAVLEDLASLAQLELERADLQAAAAQLRESDRLKDELLSIASHELRSPLGVVLGSLEFALTGELGPLSPEAAKVLEGARKSADRMLRLLNDYLSAAALESGRAPLRLSPVRLTDLARRAMAAVEVHYQKAEVTAQLSAAEPGPTARVDEDKLLEVLVNFLGNAAKHAPKGSTVTLSVAGDGARARVEVADRGPGVPAAFKPRLFEKFSQAKHGEGGTGLGLAISKAIVERHGGRVGCDDRPGGGAVFFFELPL